MDTLKLQTRHGQRGIAMTEFAIVVPILLLLMLAAAEIGRAFYQYNTLTKAVRDGARYLTEHSLQGTTGVKINITAEDQQAARNLVVYGDILGSGQKLLPNDLDKFTVTPLTLNDLPHIEVEAQYKYAPLFAGGLPTFGFGSSNLDTLFTFTATATMRSLQ